MMAPTARKLCVNLSLFCMRTQKRKRDTSTGKTGCLYKVCQRAERRRKRTLPEG